jgi:hypothetical protein
MPLLINKLVRKHGEKDASFRPFSTSSAISIPKEAGVHIALSDKYCVCCLLERKITLSDEWCEDFHDYYTT